MNRAAGGQIANAVLYEGYILYPYRPSVKNRQRWTFGGLYPQAYSQAQGGTRRLEHADGVPGRGNARTRFDVRVRFLHLLARSRRRSGSSVRPIGRPAPSPLSPCARSLQVGDRLCQTWQEAVEREVDPARTAT